MRALGVAAMAVTVALAGSVAGCGSGKSDPAAAYAKTPVKKIEQDVVAAFAGLKSVHFKGTVASSNGAQKIDLSMSRAGDCAGTVTVEGQQAEVLVSHGNGFMKADTSFWTHEANAEVAKMVADKWVTGFGDKLAQQFCPFDKLADSFKTAAPQAEKNASVTASTVDGVAAVTLRLKDKSGSYLADVAAASPHYLLTLRKKDGEGASFSDFDKPVHVTAPKGAIDISSVG